MQQRLESLVRCEEQLWPDCGRPSDTILPPHAVQGGKATLTCSFEGLGLNSGQSLTSNKIFRQRWSEELPTSELSEASERPGLACAIEVEELIRRPPTVGGAVEFRVKG